MTINRDEYQKLKNMLAANGQLESVIQAFVNHSSIRLEDLQKSIAAQDLESILKIAHAIKGSCAMLGGTQCAQLCDAIESACRHSHPGELPQLLAKLIIEIKSIAEFLQNDRPVNTQGCCE